MAIRMMPTENSSLHFDLAVSWDRQTGFHPVARRSVVPRSRLLNSRASVGFYATDARFVCFWSLKEGRPAEAGTSFLPPNAHSARRQSAFVRND
jgi:hypothetical protein